MAMSLRRRFAISSRRSKSSYRKSRVPLIDKFDIDAAPILTIGVSGRDVREVTEIVDKDIKEILQTVSGVGSIRFRPAVAGHHHHRRHRSTFSPRPVDRGRSPRRSWRIKLGSSRRYRRTGTGSRAAQQDAFPQRPRSMSSLSSAARWLSDPDPRYRPCGRLRQTPRPHPPGRPERRQPLRQKQSGTNTVDVVDEVLARLDRIEKPCRRILRSRSSRPIAVHPHVDGRGQVSSPARRGLSVADHSAVYPGLALLT